MQVQSCWDYFLMKPFLPLIFLHLCPTWYHISLSYKEEKKETLQTWVGQLIKDKTVHLLHGDNSTSLRLVVEHSLTEPLSTVSPHIHNTQWENLKNAWNHYTSRLKKNLQYLFSAICKLTNHSGLTNDTCWLGTLWSHSSVIYWICKPY